MASAQTPDPTVIPNPQTPKLLGTLSIIFASILMVCDVFTVFSVVFGPAMAKIMTSSVQAQQDQANARIKAEKDVLDAREKVAKTDEEKEKIAADRAALASRPNPALNINMSSMDAMRDPTIVRVTYFQLLTGIPLTVLMLVSGIGLVNLKGWGRKMALWTAGLKVVRLAILLVMSVAVVIPATTAAQKKQFEQMEAQMKANGGAGAPPGMSMSDLAKISSASAYAFTLIFYLLAPIFPVILLIALNRPRVVAAFGRSAKHAAATDWEELP